MAALRRIPEAAAVPLLIAVFLVAGFVSLRRESATFDETTHLAAGYAGLDRLDFRHNPEHPPLAKMWGALPVWLGGLRRPNYESPAWEGIHVPPDDPMRSRANQWTFGFELLNGPLDRPERLDPAAILVPARTMMLLLGAVLGLVVWAWARELFGPGGGVLALALYVVCPAVLAHARLVTTDVAAALGITASL